MHGRDGTTTRAARCAPNERLAVGDPTVSAEDTGAELRNLAPPGTVDWGLGGGPPSLLVPSSSAGGSRGWGFGVSQFHHQVASQAGYTRRGWWVPTSGWGLPEAALLERDGI
ncbi:hypothetical protein Purlil1_2301 [Purpureocillium lilacinum]|uniref:Uncharacterized protein n=1 Tax=Purpureocillium lilacinum TaxID=33203 RepID=A0ABR0CAD6_PURLI|nr:hypothetical protein Purlil1_2301 [Purpureocillium lilacinum]